MSTKRAYGALNVAGWGLGSRATSQNYKLWIKKLNSQHKQRIVIIATMRTILTLRARRSNPVLNQIPLSISAETASLE